MTTIYTKAMPHGTRTTVSGEFTIYHRDDAGSPDMHDDPDNKGPWHFEPTHDADPFIVFSPGYATIEDALDAAETWEMTSRAEDAYRADEEERYQEIIAEAQTWDVRAGSRGLEQS